MGPRLLGISLTALLVPSACAPSPSPATSPGAVYHADTDCTALPDPTPGDCHRPICGPGGEHLSIVDPQDLPAPGADPCRRPTCVDGVPGSELAVNASCGEGGVCGRGGACMVITQIAVGEQHACALLQSGQVACWGAGLYGEVDGKPGTSTHDPVIVPFVRDAKSIALGERYSCAMAGDGGLQCWGKGGWKARAVARNGGLHVWSGPPRLGPITMLAAGGDTTCVVTRKGDFDCWVEKQGEANEAYVKHLPSEASLIAATFGNGCVLLKDGRFQCTNIPLAGFVSPDLPLLGGKVRGMKWMGFGLENFCALDDRGMVQCWGRNGNGAVRPAEPANDYDPGEVPGVGEVVTLAVGLHRGCAIRRDGKAICWGQTFEDGFVPGHGDVPVIDALEGATLIATGPHSVCGKLRGGQLVCYGIDATEPLPPGKYQREPVITRPVF